MKKLLTCLFTLLMAVAILSPVSMRAEDGDVWRVRMEISETDRNSGAYYNNRVVEYTETASDKSGVVALGHYAFEDKDGNKFGLGYSTDPASLNTIDAVVYNALSFRSGSYLAKNAWTDAVVTVYDENGLYVDTLEYTRGDDASDLLNEVVGDDYTILVELVVDNYKAGELSTVKGGDDIDDRDQALITVLMARNPYSTDYRSNSPTYVVNKGENVQALIEEGTYANFPGYDDADSEWYDRNKDVEYIRVYDNALTKVTEDVKIHGDWAEDKAGLDRFAPAATNDKDTNGDGKVSCDEYYGTTGLVWSDEKNACVVESNGAVVVTIPNTATK